MYSFRANKLRYFYIFLSASLTLFTELLAKLLWVNGSISSAPAAKSLPSIVIGVRFFSSCSYTSGQFQLTSPIPFGLHRQTYAATKTKSVSIHSVLVVQHGYTAFPIMHLMMSLNHSISTAILKAGLVFGWTVTILISKRTANLLMFWQHISSDSQTLTNKFVNL